MSAKNKSKKLFFSQFGGEQPIPPEFIAAMEREEEVQAIPNDVGPEELSDTVIESKVETNRTDERVRRTIKKKSGNITLPFIKTDDTGAPVQILRTLYRTGTQPTVPTATTKVAVQALGNGWSIEEVMVEGTWSNTVPPVFVPGIFPRQEYSIERADVVPEEFSVVVPTLTEEVSSAGTAMPPSLVAGDLVRRETQTDTFIKRVLRRYRSLLDLPVSLVGKDTDRDKQIVTVTQTLKAVASIDSVPTALKDVKVKSLGDGTKLEETREVSEVFDQQSLEKSRPDPVPEEFRILLPTLKTEFTSAADVITQPNLDPGDLLRKEERLTEKTKKSTVVTRTGTPTGSLQDKDFDGISAVGSLFNNLTFLQRTFSLGVQAVETGFLYLSSKVKALGDGSTLRETKTISSFPQLVDSITDPVDGTTIVKVKDMVDPMTPNPFDGKTSQLAVDNYRSARIVETANAASFNNFKFIFDGTTNVDVPPQLTNVNGVVEASVGSGVYSETGNYFILGHGAGGVSLQGKAEGSAAILTDLSYNVKQVWGNNVPCKHLLFLTLGGKTLTEILVIVNNLAPGLNIQAWPKFVPVVFNVFCRGERVSARSDVSVTGHDSSVSNYLGDVTDSNSARTHGSGQSFEAGITLKVVKLPATIHAQILIGIPSPLFQTFSASASIAVNGLVGASLGVPGRVDGNIYPTIIDPSPGQQTIPTSGYYLHRFVCEPYKNGYMKVHAEVVNFANLI